MKKSLNRAMAFEPVLPGQKVPSFAKGGTGRILPAHEIPPSPPFAKGGGGEIFAKGGVCEEAERQA